MKRFIAVILCGLVITGFTMEIGTAQDNAGNPSTDQQERREASRNGDAHREELAAHAREIRAEINRVQDQFDKAREAGNETQSRELRQFLEELHEGLLRVEQELQSGEREHHLDGEKRSEHDEHRNALRRELGQLEKHIEAASNEGNEEKVRELKRHFDELHAKLTHLEQELSGGERPERREEHGEREHSEAHELEQAVHEIQQELRHLEEALNGAEREGNEDKARSIRRHMENLADELQHLERERQEQREPHGDREHHRDGEKESEHDDRHEPREEHDDGNHDDEDDRRKLEYFREVLITQLKQNEGRLREAQEAGDEGAVEELAEHQGNLFWKLREVEGILGAEDRHRDDEDDSERHEPEHRQNSDEHHEGEDDREHHGGIEGRLEHLHIAIEHLRAGGFGDLAHLAGETGYRIERDLHDGHNDREHHDGHDDREHHDGHNDRDDISREDVVRHVLELEEHLQRLHQELERVKHFLEQRER